MQGASPLASPRLRRKVCRSNLRLAVPSRNTGRAPPLSCQKVSASYREWAAQPRRVGNRGEMELSVADATAAFEMVPSPGAGQGYAAGGKPPPGTANRPASPPKKTEPSTAPVPVFYHYPNSKKFLGSWGILSGSLQTVSPPVTSAGRAPYTCRRRHPTRSRSAWRGGAGQRSCRAGHRARGRR